MFLTRLISFTNFFVATSALGFQVGVLYPWHKQLDDDFEALKKEHLRVLKAIDNMDLHFASSGQVKRAAELIAKHSEQQQRPGGILGGLWGWRQ